jgi:hypothetical protein
LREKIALNQQNRMEQFCGKIEVDERYFGVVKKEKEEEDLLEKFLYLAFLSVAFMFTPTSLMIPKHQP